jgi:hypothetical protein
MKTIEFTQAVTIAGKAITSISVHQMTFVDLASAVKEAQAVKGVNFDSALQRQRMILQTHFMAGTERVIPEQQDVMKLPASVARAIIAELDDGLVAGDGKILSEGDGSVTPIHIRLGDPIKLKDGKGKASEIAELEFLAPTYGDIEDVLAATDDISKAFMLLEKVASPVGFSLPRIPSGAISQISMADGLMIMRKVLPLF